MIPDDRTSYEQFHATYLHIKQLTQLVVVVADSDDVQYAPILF